MGASEHWYGQRKFDFVTYKKDTMHSTSLNLIKIDLEGRDPGVWMFACFLDSPQRPRLISIMILKYLHWSVFEICTMTSNMKNKLIYDAENWRVINCFKYINAFQTEGKDADFNNKTNRILANLVAECVLCVMVWDNLTEWATIGEICVLIHRRPQSCVWLGTYENRSQDTPMYLGLRIAPHITLIRIT